MPRDNKLQFRTGSTTPSASDFVTGEPAWDSAAGKLWIKTAASVMQQIGAASLDVYQNVAAFPATGSATVLYLSQDSSKIYRWVSSAYVEVGPESGGGGGSATTDASLLTEGTLADARLSGNVVLTGDSRLSNSRTPTSHAASHASGGSDALTLAASQITGLGSLATASSVAYSSLTGTPSTFAPSSHKSSHATGGSDALSASDIGAAAASHTHSADAITSGTLSQARLDFVPIHPFLLMGG